MYDPTSQIASALSRLKIRWSQRDDGVFSASFRNGEGEPTLEIFYASECDDNVLAVRGSLAEPIDPDDWPRALGVINSWNAEHRWPTAALVILGAHKALVTGEVNFLMTADEALLAAQLEVATATLCSFHEWVSRRELSRATLGGEAR